MIDHISIGVRDLERSARFYEATLAPLGLERVVTRPATIGFGKAYPEFWINWRPRMAPVAPDGGSHICLRSKSAAEGLRPHDRVRYYAAFIRDPDGNRIEAVTFLAE
jgi:catechol 2,3-dioxygenase-like lactoylglutathione lyase family enzyme